MIRQGHSTIDELVTTLRPLRPVCIRGVVQRTDDGPLMVAAIAEAGRGSAGFDEATYDYGHVAFIKAVIDGSMVADWLDSRRGEVDGVKFFLPQPSPNCNWVRHASRAYSRYATLSAVPHTEYSVDLGNQKEQVSTGIPLAGVGQPFFRDEKMAAASVLLDEHAAPSNRAVPSGEMLVRIAHPESYIASIRVSPAAIIVSVLGEDCGDVHLQVSSAGDRREERVGEPREIRVPVVGADSAEAWVALVRGKECLDFRTIGSRWPDSREREGVVYEPDDLSERLDRLRLGGESEKVEFKRDVTKGDRIPKAVAAFANNSGGTIIIGIHDGTWDVVGIDGDVHKACERLHNIVRNNVSPLPDYLLSTHTIRGCTVIALQVEPGDHRPYGVDPRVGGATTCGVGRTTGSRSPKRCGRSANPGRPAAIPRPAAISPWLNSRVLNRSGAEAPEG